MLSEGDRAILEFERAFVEDGPKDMIIEFSLGLTSAAYYEQLRLLVGSTEALAHDPLTILRLRRLLDGGGDEREMAIG